MTDEDEKLRDEVAGLRAELARLSDHRFVRIHNSTFRLMFYQFLRGLSFGLGTVMGASILVSVLVYMLSWIDFIPIIGEWATELARQIELERQ
ncbi:MAG: DUF5665 domain-containing protein [Pseudomonadota bacterium]